MMNLCTVPAGTYEVCSRTINKQASGERCHFIFCFVRGVRSLTLSKQRSGKERKGNCFVFAPVSCDRYTRAVLLIWSALSRLFLLEMPDGFQAGHPFCRHPLWAPYLTHFQSRDHVGGAQWILKTVSSVASDPLDNAQWVLNTTSFLSADL